MPTADREMFLRLVGRIAAEPEGADRHLAYTTDTVTRAAWEDHVMVHYVVTRFFVAVMEADIYDVSRAFNEEMISSVKRSGIGGGSMRWLQPPVGAGVERSGWSRVRG
ncbi:hypothetical protein, partial [Streptomyces sp. NPDC001153]